MTSHYPLDGIDLDFSRYEHRPLGARDIMVYRIMEDYMGPRHRTSDIYSREFVFDQRCDRFFAPFKRRVRELGLDMHVLARLLQTEFNWSFTQSEFKRLYAVPSDFWAWFDAGMWPEEPKTFEQIALGLVEQHYLESGPSMRLWLKYFHSFYSEESARKHAPGWKKDMIKHLKTFQPFSAAHHHNTLYSGGHYVPISGPLNIVFSIEPNFFGTPWLSMMTPLLPPRPFHGPNYALRRKTPLGDKISIYRSIPQRSSSEPPPGAWSTASINGLDRLAFPDKWVIYFPRRPLSELDKMSRRRSLSRTHIRAMFTDKPKYMYDPNFGKRRPIDTKHPCANCNQHGHLTKRCTSSCGYCNSLHHKASACPVKVTNRCKCRPFPQFHIAAKCYIRCSRSCGNPHHPGHCKHQNAMTCSHRCCMCGIKGHSGRQCSLKKCPCGEQHLTQDCRWKVECPAKNCNFYLCHLHCRECGVKKDKSSKDQFVGRTCQDCLKNGKPVLAKAE
ncbi:hypothetical protein F4820DRAFT_271216 [Hypoxylon rubiginosum]|uniref:Uncharacterized protein n=1 Tax=Hypoxylon rubiginosum TaxID=110542 RepID=A0ACB9Z3S7_9PEZI|nr:hypothetical protein F4820DRAFT_271216 [Hypoxylon rubiginosum]